MEPYTKVMFTITKFGLQVLWVHADVLKYSNEYFTNDIVPIDTEPRRGRYYESCMHTSIQYYRADRAAVGMHDGAAVRSTPLLASAGGQSTATRCIKGRKHCHNKASQLTEKLAQLTHCLTCPKLVLLPRWRTSSSTCRSSWRWRTSRRWVWAGAKVY